MKIFLLFFLTIACAQEEPQGTAVVVVEEDTEPECLSSRKVCNENKDCCSKLCFRLLPTSKEKYCAPSLSNLFPRPFLKNFPEWVPSLPQFNPRAKRATDYDNAGGFTGSETLEVNQLPGIGDELKTGDDLEESSGTSKGTSLGNDLGTGAEPESGAASMVGGNSGTEGSPGTESQPGLGSGPPIAGRPEMEGGAGMGSKQGMGGGPGMGRRPGMGGGPGMGRRPGMGGGPGMGRRPGMGDGPEMGWRPGMGDGPGMGRRPGMGGGPEMRDSMAGERRGRGRGKDNRPGGNNWREREGRRKRPGNPTEEVFSNGRIQGMGGAEKRRQEDETEISQQNWENRNGKDQRRRPWSETNRGQSSWRSQNAPFSGVRESNSDRLMDSESKRPRAEGGQKWRQSRKSGNSIRGQNKEYPNDMTVNTRGQYSEE